MENNLSPGEARKLDRGQFLRRLAAGVAGGGAALAVSLGAPRRAGAQQIGGSSECEQGEADIRRVFLCSGCVLICSGRL